MVKKIQLSAGVLAAAISANLPIYVYAAETENVVDADKKTESTKVDEEMIVTGVAQPVTKLSSSNSVTALSADEVIDFAPRSTAEIFRNIPGIQAEATGGDANANIKVRGLPISAGGARYLSIQEDSTPILLIGDMDFATSDSFLRFDNSVRSVQSIRGGAAATQAPNSPGGIINFISNTGDTEGGSAAYTTGLDYNSQRVDLSYGAPLEDGWRYHIGGFIRDGQGVRDVPDDIESGYQVKANATKEFENGYVRINFKKLDDSVPTYLPIPARYAGGGKYDPVGVDFGSGTLYLQGTDQLNREAGRQSNSLTSGFETNVLSLGIEGEVQLNDSTTVGFLNKTSSISGSFVSPFPAEVYSNAAGTAARIHYFNTQLDSLDNIYTDLNIKKEYDAFSVKMGVFRGVQDYVTQWGWNTYFRQLDGGLTPTAGPGGEPSFVPGHPLWGDCCSRSYDFEIEDVAPYVTLTGELGDAITWDASVRRDRWNVKGNYAMSGPADADGYLTYGPAHKVGYELGYTSWSLGTNYALSDSTALFGSVSHGGSATSPSRVTDHILANGKLDAKESGFSDVDQLEVGYKLRTENASLYLTLFGAKTREAGGFEVTTQKVIENSYKSKGVEIEGDYRFGQGFSVMGSVTFTDAEITASSDATVVGNKPRRQADYIYNITPSYSMENSNVGVNFVGTDEVYVADANKATFDGFVVTNLFWNYNLDPATTVSLNVNNLLDEVGFTEGEVGAPAVGDLVQVRPINGRTTSLSLRHNF